MSHQVIEENPGLDPKTDAIIQPTVEVLDARRRLEDRLEEARLHRETQEFDFN